MAKPSLYDGLAHFREAVTSNHDLGDRFEGLLCRYLELDLIYAERFPRVWMWNEWPHKGSVGDMGIDLVAEERANAESSEARSTAKGNPPRECRGVHPLCAIACKFYLPDHTIAKRDNDSSFVTAVEACSPK